YRYDNAGNLLQDENNTYEYDDFRRTSKVTTKVGIMQINRYDAEGLRHEMEENGKLVQFIFNENREVIAEKEDGNITRLIRTSDLWAMEANPEKTWYHYASDEQGSTIFLTDEQSNVKNRYTYDAFGNTIEAEEQISNRYQYTGQQLDPITQQYYLRARFYNPAIARFTQEDEYHGDGLNLYAYCANNPVDYYDPSGYACDGLKDPIKNDKVVRNWKGEEVKIPEGHKMSPRDLDISDKPMYREGPFTSKQREEFLKGNSAGTHLAPHHRHQIPVRDGGVIDEIPGPGHPEGNQHTAGTPNRHPNKSIFNSESGGKALRQKEISNHWKEKGRRLVKKRPNLWFDLGPEK
ncbi:RHS repeat-associated core domain-containing protein, partial [Selenomonas sp. WCT3]|uniref:RHS repeat domain-containing protein n=1 Tax=Selenomonas sp. WCT3 TaxID=3158785 RepID=UPI00088F5BE6